MEYVESQKVNVEFRMDSIPDGVATAQAGHPVYIEVPFITIQIPGSQNTIIDTKVDETHKKRFPDQWRRFEAGMSTEGIKGWTLETWPQVNTAQVKTLKYMGVHTVEQLADLSDVAAQSVGMGAMELRTKARAALQAAAGNASVESQAAVIEQLRADIAALQAQQGVQQPEAPRRGRPPKGE